MISCYSGLLSTIFTFTGLDIGTLIKNDEKGFSSNIKTRPLFISL